MIIASHQTLPLHTIFNDLDSISRSQQCQTGSTENFMILSNEVKTLSDFYLHRQDYVYIPIFLLLVLHVFKGNNLYVS